MRVTLIIASLGAGGAERVLATMANHWAAHGWPITLVTLDATTGDCLRVHPRVERIGLDAMATSAGPYAALVNNVRRLARLRSAIRASRPHAVISFTSPMTVLAIGACRAERVPVIVSERVDPSQHRLSPAWAALRRIAYPRASAVVVQTPEVRRWGEGFLRPENIHVIPNPASADTLAEALPFDGAPGPRPRRHVTPTVLAVGRLDPQKGFDLLIRAFAACHNAHPQWRLRILGDGPERARLEALSWNLGVRAAIELAGRVPTAALALRESELFVLSSRYEGFPNALLEAMAAGLPVIATDCPSGPRHIVRDGIDGVLVPRENVDALAHAMRALMADPQRRQDLGARATEVVTRFSVERIMAEWERVLQRVAGGASQSGGT
jgi:GalNAc-alpha-(1->4)-GalNAc-alpha-(1->3)-diNAcBac-PP-undecaprenol alpha-1,4-N-acetyl-D-galactosaminyltransferase